MHHLITLSSGKSCREAAAAAGRIVLNTLYPRRCPVCESILTDPRELICRRCGPRLPFIHEPLCRKCGRPLADDRKEYCIECAERHHVFQAGRAVFTYTGALRDALLRMKFQNRREYAQFFAAAMAAHEHGYLKQIRPDLIIPVPMNSRKRRERGFDQCILLARQLSGLTGIPVSSDTLLRTRYTRPQKGLGAAERRENLRDAFSLTKPENARGTILLLDDIYTTGSTMDEAAATLQRDGCCKVFFLTVCMGAGREEAVNLMRRYEFR